MNKSQSSLVSADRRKLTVLFASPLISSPFDLASCFMVAASVCVAYSFACCAFFLVKGTQPGAQRYTQRGEGIRGGGGVKHALQA